jgi:hypothetical protein
MANPPLALVLSFLPDGKSRTVTTSRTDAMGKKISSTAVYDRH